MSNEGVDAGLSVPMPTPDAGGEQPETGAMPQPSSAFERAVRHGDVVLGEQPDFLLVGPDAMRGEHAVVEKPGTGKRADASRSEWGDQHVRESLPLAAPAAEELVLCLALREVSRDGQVELVARAIEV